MNKEEQDRIDWAWLTDIRHWEHPKKDKKSEEKA